MELKKLVLENKLHYMEQGLALTDGLLWGNKIDLIGYLVSSKEGPISTAISVKKVPYGSRWPLSSLNEDEFLELKKSADEGAAVMVLIGFEESGRFFLLPFSELKKKWKLMLWSSGPSTVRQEDAALIEVFPPKFFKPLMDMPEKFLTVEYAAAV